MTEDVDLLAVLAYAGLIGVTALVLHVFLERRWVSKARGNVRKR
jgi:hypothetical protein